MTQIIGFLTNILGYVMRFCYSICADYTLSIILFTLLTKAVLFPLSVLTQKNAIRMVRLRPKLDEIKIRFIDDKDRYTDAQLALYKEYKYNPFLDILPLLFQIPIVLGLVGVIYRPLSFMLGIDAGTVSILEGRLGESDGLSQIAIIEAVQNGTISVQGIPADTVSRIASFATEFLGLDLCAIPSVFMPVIPVLSGASAWLLCFAQNRMNVLQFAQSRLNKIITAVITIAFSVYFAFIVPGGVGLYWIFGNLFAILLMFVTNLVIPPEKYVDCDKIKRMRAQKEQKERTVRKYRKREAADYKRFFAEENKSLMFYSEQNGFYKYFSGMIGYICDHSDIRIHYVTSDPDDNIFSDTRPNIVSYYIASDRYLVPLFMRLDCDMCVMTVPDLEKYHIKRSRVRKDVEYVFACHGIGSISLYRKGALDNFDTILCPGKDQFEEIRAQERIDNKPEKLIVEAGYPLMDEMLKSYESSEHTHNDPPRIMIAPSWQADNIIDLCAEKIIDELSSAGFDVILRPHPRQVGQEPERFDILKEKYADNKNVMIQTDFSQTNPVMESDILVTDWSDISWEFAFVTKHPVIYIDTPMKITDPDYERLGITPINKSLRSSIGEVVGLDELERISAVAEKMLANKEEYSQRIDSVYKERVYNIGRSSELCGRYIIRSLNAKHRRDRA